jgi:hypothetical protein
VDVGKPAYVNSPHVNKERIMLQTPLRVVDRQTLSTDDLKHYVPAAFAQAPDTNRTSAHYTFISTAEVVQALQDAGFVAAHARQTGVRGGAPQAHARHLIRFTHTRETVTLVDAIPQLILINSHDGSSAYTLRAGLYRPICTNGLITPLGDFGLIHVAHRGNIVAEVVAGALTIARGFAGVATKVAHMHAKLLAERQRWELAAFALTLRYPRPDQHKPLTPDQLLLPRRPVDFGNSLWQTFNVIQENTLQGGIVGKSANGRATRSRGIRAIREDVRINSQLWQHALTLL